MPYDPSLPQENTLADAAQMRAQFAGLNDKIDAVPAGPPGPQGPPFANAVIDGVGTLNPGDNATVGVSFDGTNVHFTFGIPRGSDGMMGGIGPQGIQGVPGPQGAPFANAVIDAVTTLNPGDNATVGVSFDGSNVHFTFGIPRGADGTNGTNGSDGTPGIQGPPGEVTAQQLADGITTALATAAAAAAANSSANSNGVATLDTPFADPDLEAMRQKMNELIVALRR